MIETFVNQNMLIRDNPSIADYLRTGQSDYSKIYNEARLQLVGDLINSGLEVRRLCQQYSLQASVTKTAAFTGTITTNEDYAQRTRLVIPVSAITGDGVFTLQGTNDDGSNYYDISLVDAAGDLATQMTIDAVAIGLAANTYLFTETYKDYRLKLISIGTTVTYSAYLIEDIYTRLHLAKARSLVYGSMVNNEGDHWQNKKEEYEQEYMKLLEVGRFLVDVDDDGSISEREGDMHISQNIVFRP